MLKPKNIHKNRVKLPEVAERGQSQSLEIAEGAKSKSSAARKIKKWLGRAVLAAVPILVSGQVADAKLSKQAEMEQVDQVMESVDLQASHLMKVYRQILPLIFEGKEQDWKEEIRFENGLLYAKLLYAGKEKNLLKDGVYEELVVSDQVIDRKRSSKVLDQSFERVKLFKKAFEEWKVRPLSENGFWTKDTKQYVDMAKYLKSYNVNKEDLHFQFFIQENVPEFLEMVSFQKNDKSVNSKYNYKFANERVHFQDAEITYDLPFYNEQVLGKVTYNPMDLTPGVLSEHDFISESKRYSGTEIYDRDQNIIQKQIKINGLPNVMAVEWNDGKPLYDGKVLRKEVTRWLVEMENGEPKSKITTFESMKKANPNFKTDQYIDYLAESLTTDELFDAWFQLIYQYTFDSPDRNKPLMKGKEESRGDYWQSPEETIERRENGRFLGDCEDSAFLAREILARQGKAAYVLHAVNHALAFTLEKDKQGKFYLRTYDNWGVTVNGVRLPESNGVVGYNTPAQAMERLRQFFLKEGTMSSVFSAEKWLRLLIRIPKVDLIVFKNPAKPRWKKLVLPEKISRNWAFHKKLYAEIDDYPSHRIQDVYYSVFYEPEYLAINEGSVEDEKAPEVKKNLDGGGGVVAKGGN